MGRFFADVLSFHHEVCLYDTNPAQLKFVYNAIRTTSLEEVRDFQPELLINAVTIKYTIDAFRQVLPYIPENCIMADIASVKTGLKDFYEQTGHRFVSTHPMFGPTFASLSDLSTQSAIIIKESDFLGKAFFKDLYHSLQLNIFEYSFEKHDQMTAYSLSIPFASTLVFGAVMKHQEAPGTTFKKHMAIAKGLLSEDDYMLQEILFNPYAPKQIEKIRDKLGELLDIIEHKDADRMQDFLKMVRKNLE
jgi:prephenate dehydrogenase